MKKRILLLAIVLLALYNNPSAKAQEVRLDSLWAKQGGIGAMSFSPDSKTLILAEPQKLAGGSGTIRFYDVVTGIEKDSIPETEYYDVRYTPDGKRIVQVGFGGEIKLYNAETYKLEKSINAPQNAGYIDFSTDKNIIVSAGSNLITVVDIAEGVVKAVINRPDKYSTGPNQTEYYWNGKVTFSADGKYIIGKYENSLVRWDWQNAPTKPEILIGDIGNRAIIGFSPDKKYMVQQSNYVWDLQQGKQVIIEGMESNYTENGDVADFSSDSEKLICTRNAQTRNDRLIIVDIPTRKLVFTSNYSANSLSLSPDNQMLSFHGTGNYTRLYRLNWEPNSSVSEQEISPRISVSPLPGQEIIHIEVQTPTPYHDCRISIVSSVGATVREIYQGNITVGKQTYMFLTAGLSSGQYSVVMSYGGKTTSVPFIITK